MAKNNGNKVINSEELAAAIDKIVNKYRGNDNLKAVGAKIEYTAQQIREYKKCMKDPIYFCKNYVKIINLDRGLINFDLWPYQERMIEEMKGHRFFIARCPRQSSKTTCVCGYLLWYVLFHKEKTVAVLANKEAGATEILSRIQLAYEYLPQWLQQGMKEWNKRSFLLENGSKIISGATSSSAIRGKSVNVLYIDELCFIHRNQQEEFFTSVYPTISSSKKSKVIITSTPNGFDYFAKIWLDSEDGRNTFHRFEINWWDTPGRDEKWKQETINNTSERQFEQEFNCQFLGSANTLIDPLKLQTLRSYRPLREDKHSAVWKDPIKDPRNPLNDHRYVICVDPSRGDGGDYQAFLVIDVTKLPYEIVARYRNNNISEMLFPNFIYEFAKRYNEAWVLVENNLGKQILDILYQDLEYENVFMTAMKGRAGQIIGGGFGAQKVTFGVTTTKPVKRIGCLNLKSMIEHDQLILNDHLYIHELSRFVDNDKGSFEAEPGDNDDLVMCSVLFGWLAQQPYFKDNTAENDVRARLYEENTQNIENEIFAIFSTETDQHEDEAGVIETYGNF